MKSKVHNILIESQNEEINFIYKKGVVFLSRSETAKLFGVEKKLIKNILKSLNTEDKFEYLENKKNNKIIKIYSIDIVILIGYELKSFYNTRELIKINRIIKTTYGKRIYLLNIIGKKYNEIKNKLVYSLNLCTKKLRSYFLSFKKMKFNYNLS